MESSTINAGSGSGNLTSLRRIMIGNGVLMIFMTAVGGVGLWMYILGGFEIVPGYMVHFQLPGTEGGWQRAHTGPAMNGIMVMAVAFALPMVQMSFKLARRIGWVVMLDGWANVGFYFFGNFSPNRGLAFGNSDIGPSNIFSILALGPAYLFGVLLMIALAILGWKAIFPGQLSDESGSSLVSAE